MKLLTNGLAPKWLLTLGLSLFIFISCQKETNHFPVQQENSLAQRDTAQNNSNDENGHLKQTKTFSSDVVVRWLNMQLDMLRVPLDQGATTQAANRALAYCGIATYEAVVNGMPGYQTLAGQLNDFSDIPVTQPGKAYHWAASANAALAAMNRKLFPGASFANKTKIDSLENALQAGYAAETDPATLNRSIAFGKDVAASVFKWA